MKRKILLLLPIIILILFLIPLIFNSKSQSLDNYIGTKLDELNYIEVNFTNEYDQTKLAGMLFLPEGSAPFPVAVFIHGSGFSFRKNIWYLSLVKHLQDNGIAVLLPDKRGSEKSEGDWIGATPELLTTDTESAIRFIKNQDLFTFSDIGLVAVSQGGWIAPIVASKAFELSFIVNISGTTVTGDEQLLFEEINNISAYTYRFIAKMIAPITTNNLKKKKAVAPFISFDPIPYWEKVNIPTFFAYGEVDPNCPAKMSVERLKEKGLAHFPAKIYPHGDHGLLEKSRTKINETFLNDMIVFIKTHID